MSDPQHFGNRMFKVINDQAKASWPKFMLPHLGQQEEPLLLQDEVHANEKLEATDVPHERDLMEEPPSAPVSPAKPATPEWDPTPALPAPSLGSSSLPCSPVKLPAASSAPALPPPCLGGPLEWAKDRRTDACLEMKIPETLCEDASIDAGTVCSLNASGEQTLGVRVVTTSHAHAIDDGLDSDAPVAAESRSASNSVGGSLAVEAACEIDTGTEALAPDGVAKDSRTTVADDPGVVESRGQALTAFADQLVAATERAPERLAERLAEELQQYCLEQAGMGLTSFTWDLPLPSSKRSFMNQAAGEFVSRVEALGFERVEWWNGREWRQSQGRFHILHDTIYDKYHMRLRVRWLDRLPPDAQLEEPGIHHKESLMSTTSVSGTEMEHVQHLLELQKQMLEAAMAASTGANLVGVIEGYQR